MNSKNPQARQVAVLQILFLLDFLTERNSQNHDALDDFDEAPDTPGGPEYVLWHLAYYDYIDKKDGRKKIRDRSRAYLSKGTEQAMRVLRKKLLP